MAANISRLQSVLNFFMHGILICYRVVSKYTKRSTILKTLLLVLLLCLWPALHLRYMPMYLVFSTFASRPTTNKAYEDRLTINLPVLWCLTTKPWNIPPTDMNSCWTISNYLQCWKKILWLQMWRWSLGLHSYDMTAVNTTHDLVINRG